MHLLNKFVPVYAQGSEFLAQIYILNRQGGPVKDLSILSLLLNLLLNVSVSSKTIPY